MTLAVVLGFPLILVWGYSIAYLLLRRDRRALEGGLGFALYLALLAIPLAAVLARHPTLPAERFAPTRWSPAWAAAGAAIGLALWGVQRLLARRRPGGAGVWAGPPGWAGYALLLLPVAYIVLAEEVVWRGYLTPRLGLPLAAAAFALHHYHFGARHVAFTFVAGLLWGGLFLAEERLYAAAASHLAYNAKAWAWIRQGEAAGGPPVTASRPPPAAPPGSAG